MSDNNSSVHFMTERDEWKTPKWLLSLIAQCLGGIDLDPCSDGNHVPAKKHYTIKEDGLFYHWYGTVYMNPPYGKDVYKWAYKFHQEHFMKHMSAGIALFSARTDTRWYRLLRNYPKCFLFKRLAFDDTDNKAPFPSMLVYAGNSVDIFEKTFRKYGDVYIRYLLRAEYV